MRTALTPMSNYALNNKEPIYNLDNVRAFMSDKINETMDEDILNDKDEFESYLDKMNTILESKFPGVPLRVGGRITQESKQIRLYNIAGCN